MPYPVIQYKSGFHQQQKSNCGFNASRTWDLKIQGVFCCCCCFTLKGCNYTVSSFHYHVIITLEKRLFYLQAFVTAKLFAVSMLSTWGTKLKGASDALGLVLWRKIANRKAVYSWSVFLMKRPPISKQMTEKKENVIFIFMPVLASSFPIHRKIHVYEHKDSKAWETFRIPVSGRILSPPPSSIFKSPHFSFL